MKKMLFIFNPISGKARIQFKLYEIVRFYTDHGYVVTIYPTSSIGDGYSFVKNLDEAYELIVCSGGDGTLNEIVSAMMDAGIHATLGYIPSGSTNDFGRSVGIPMNTKKALEISCAGCTFNVDVGRLNERHFVYVAGFGLFTRVSYITPQKIKNVVGYLAYLLEGIKELSELKAYKMSVQFNGENIEGQFIVGLVMNSYSIAGFKNPVSALTKLNDGFFEVMLIRMPKNVLELQGIIAALLGEASSSEQVICFQAPHIEIRSEPLQWVVDGEYGGQYEEVVIENQQQAIAMSVKQRELKQMRRQTKSNKIR